ncbi:hypothetical protein Tco_1432650 [Tanacetum coccineum]
MEVFWIQSIGLCSSWFLVKCRHRYAISSLMDTAYRMSEQFLQISLFKLQNACLLANLQKKTCNENQISENATSRAQLQAKFSEPQLNQNGTNVNTKFEKPSTFGNKLYYVTPLPKTQFITKVVEKHDLSKAVTSHLHTNKIIAKCIKVLAPGLLRIKSEPINAYFKKNKVVHRDYLKVTKEHVETLQELLVQARVLTPTDKNLHYAYVNKRKKAKSVKQKQKTQWKPTGRIFTIVGHGWEPTGRMLGVEGKTCPLPQIPLPL